jgi:hypothetical protein
VGDGNDPPTLGVTFKVNEVVAVKNTGCPVLLSVNHFHLSMVRMVRRSTTAPIFVGRGPGHIPGCNAQRLYKLTT